MNKKLLVVLPLVLCLFINVMAKDYPADDVTVIIPWGEGGFTDVMVRPLAKWLENYFGVPFVIENIPGGGGVIGSIELQNRKPDGYTIGTTSFSTITSKYLSPNPPDLDKVETVAHVFSIPAALTVRADSQFKTLEDFVDYAKKNPGAIMTSNSGFGASVHMYTLMFEQVAGIELTHVPYESGGDCMTAVLGGHVDATFSPLPDVVDQVRSGDLRLLAIATLNRHDNYPDVPTFVEKGYDFVIGNYTGIVAPKGMSREQIDILADALKKAIEDEELRSFMLANEFKPEYMDPEGFREFLNKTAEDIDYLVKELGIVIVDD
ncbi:MAG: tripartite tricarboxylate transporter substrate binding protein [Halanaerobiaceae bacterium]|jgi:tripartite-type tricarboxylate transporter receptor subunit TctC|nr:tripartite tricarboxylate transporter substrate binding protein [Halanaerobiaceae bacterium]